MPPPSRITDSAISSSASVDTPGCGRVRHGTQGRGHQCPGGGHRIEFAGAALRDDLAVAQPRQGRSSVYLPSARKRAGENLVQRAHRIDRLHRVVA